MGSFGGVDEAGGQIDPVTGWSIRDGRSSDRKQEFADNHGVKWSQQSSRDFVILAQSDRML